MLDRGLVDPGRIYGQIQSPDDIVAGHGCKELPGNDVVAVIIQNGREIVPAPADYLQICEVRLPQLMYAPCLVTDSSSTRQAVLEVPALRVLGISRLLHLATRVDLATGIIGVLLVVCFRVSDNLT